VLRPVPFPAGWLGHLFVEPAIACFDIPPRFFPRRPRRRAVIERFVVAGRPVAVSRPIRTTGEIRTMGIRTAGGLDI
jgi:hypothetical protein